MIGLEERLDEMFTRLALSFEDQAKLFEYATKMGVEIFSTPFDFESVDFLDSLGVNAFKIASMDLVNLPLIKYTSEKGRPVLLSTGMSSLGEIENAIKKAGKPLIESVELIDRYEGENIDSAKCSQAFRLRYRGDCTLKESDINPLHDNVRKALEKKFSAILRS